MGQAPDGFYKGTLAGRKTSWLGKKFDASRQTGINVFDAGNGMQKERSPFVTYYGKGMRDTNLEVLVIDYNIPGNPWWLRLVRDEIVPIGPNHYRGKILLRLLPGFPFVLGSFELQR